MPKITVRAGERTSPAQRFLDGRVYTVHETTPIPAVGSSGTLFGIPGVMVGGPDGLVWEIQDPLPAPPHQQTGVGLADLLAVLTEIRDLLKERPPYAGPRIQHTTGFASPEEAAWSAPGADGSASSSVTGTTCTGHCDAKA